MSEKPEFDAAVERVWRRFLTHGEVPQLGQQSQSKFLDFRNLMRRLPKDPRCPICYAPFEGLGGTLSKRLFGVERSKLNPKMCSACEQFAAKFHGGAEVEATMLFADVRGSTTLAEGMAAIEFGRLINRFYTTATDVMVRSNALIEKLIGDEVVGLFVSGMAGAQHARVAISAAQDILRATGHADAAGAWLPVGIGVHTGTAYIGAVGSTGGMNDIAALGDAVNTTARLASQAKAGEVLVSAEAAIAAALDMTDLEVRRLQLKGKSDAVDVRVIRVES